MLSKLCIKQKNVILPLGILRGQSDIVKQVCRATFLYAFPSWSCHPPKILAAARRALPSSTEPAQVPDPCTVPSLLAPGLRATFRK